MRSKVIDHSLALILSELTIKFDWNCPSTSSGQAVPFRAGLRVLPAHGGSRPPNFVRIIPNFAYFFNENQKYLGDGLDSQCSMSRI